MRMRKWLTGMLAGALVLPAWAAQDMATMNEVSRTWDRYAALSSQDKVEAVDLLSGSSLAHTGFLRDMALYASPDQLRRLPVLDRVVVYLLRATQTEAALQAMDDRAVATLCVSRGWINTRPPQPDAAIPSLSHVTVVGDQAIGELAPPTETQFQFGPAFVREDGQWRFLYTSMVEDMSFGMDEQIRRTGMSESRVLEMSLSNSLQSQAPSLATLDRALLDDAAKRTRLNERWPDYSQWQHLRVRAVVRKAEEGDAFAQFVTGSLLYGGEIPAVLPKDEAAGLAWWEKASEGGHGDAAWMTFITITGGKEGQTDAAMLKALPHLQRAVAQGRPPEALLAQSNYYLDGMGGLPRDCRQAAEWAARAEEAGAEPARNERVWIWATCPVAGQRDPVQALELAQHMIRREETLAWHELDTVAAALAANHDFEQAVRFESRAVEKMSADPEYSGRERDAVLKRMKARLSRYRRGRDYVLDYRMIDELRTGRQ
ncbi:hypothetical protein [Pseudoxanthomonas sp. SE1]|uniref:hypothetical protein n=1 Tax=Pseudoxanthomonas sp. SE1 TaxID=1664560 RepID=UPI00240E049C|nr:hypothetical protein [Pseudoxanthomonas sp. SE1]WFC42370.1 hypothetical protein OY559_02225 [Pseudoxanthomonas sp. SE1]